MKKTIIFVCLTALVGFASSCSGNKSKEAEPAEQSAMKVIYTCRMHPQVVQDQPGNCPICGMTLIKKEVPATDSTMMMQPSDMDSTQMPHSGM